MSRLVISILLFAVLLLLGGALAQMMVRDAGVMMLTWNGWVVETTFWTGLALILSFIVLMILLAWVWRKIGPARLLNKYRSRRDQKVAKKETLKAIDSWLRGAEDQALQSLSRVVASGGSDRLPAAISLAIGFTHADWPDRCAALVANDPELKLFVKTLQAERYWQMNKHDDFLTLMQNEKELNVVPWLRERWWQAMLIQGKSVQLIALVNEAPNLLPEKRHQWMINAANEAFRSAHGKADAVNGIMKSLSKVQRQLPEIIAAEIKYLISVNQHDSAFKRFKALMAMPDQIEQADLVLDIQVDNLVKLNFMEAKQPSQAGPVYCRTLGILNLKQQLWGNAQSWLEQGWQLADRSSGVQLANLFEMRNMNEQAAKLYKDLAKGIFPARQVS